MPVEVRAASTDDVERVAELWEEYLAHTQFAGRLPYDRATTVRNLRGALGNGRVIPLVGTYGGVVTSFLFASIDYWVFNDQPFLAHVSLYPGKDPTHAAGLALMRDLHRRLDERKITKRVVTFYSGIKEEKMSALLSAMGYTHAGQVMMHGV